MCLDGEKSKVSGRLVSGSAGVMGACAVVSVTWLCFCFFLTLIAPASAFSVVRRGWLSYVGGWCVPAGWSATTVR